MDARPEWVMPLRSVDRFSNFISRRPGTSARGSGTVVHCLEGPSLSRDLALAMMRPELVLVIGWGSLVPLLEHGAELITVLEVRLPLFEVLVIGCGHSGVP